jgi:sec-independent protein translocase protein TatA
MPTLGPIELGLILLIVLAVFGAGRLANVGGDLGRSIRSFRREVAASEEPATTDVADTGQNMST